MNRGHNKHCEASNTTAQITQLQLATPGEKANSTNYGDEVRSIQEGQVCFVDETHSCTSFRK